MTKTVDRLVAVTLVFGVLLGIGATKYTNPGASSACIEYETEDVKDKCIGYETEEVTETVCDGQMIIGTCFGDYVQETHEVQGECNEWEYTETQTCVEYANNNDDDVDREEENDYTDTEPDNGDDSSNNCWVDFWCSDEPEETGTEITCGGDKLSNDQVSGREMVVEEVHYSDGSTEYNPVKSCVNAYEYPHVCQQGTCVKANWELNIVNILSGIGIIG